MQLIVTIDFSCPLSMTVSFDFVPLRLNHLVCLGVVSYDSVTMFTICLVPEQHRMRNRAE